MVTDINMFNPKSVTLKIFRKTERIWFVLEFMYNDETVSIFFDKEDLETVKRRIVDALENPERIDVT